MSNAYYTSFFLRSLLILMCSTLYWSTARAQTLEWVAHTPASFPVGADDYGEDIARDAMGNVYVTGRFEQTADFDPGAGTANLSSIGTRAIYVAKYDASGAYQWAFKIGANLSNDGFGIAVDGSGNVLVTGAFGGTADFDPGAGTANLTSMGGSDIFVAKYTSSGDYLWAINMGGTSSDRGYAIAVDGADNVLVTGSLSGEIFVAKYSSSGIYQWTISMGGAGLDQGYSIAVDGSDNVLVTGNFFGTVDFDPGAGTANLNSVGSAVFSDIFVAKYSSSGAYQWAFSLGGTSIDQGNGIAVDGSDNVLVTGFFQDTVDFDPGVGTVNYTSAGFTDGFVAKYSPAGAYQWAFPLGGTNSDDGEGIAVDGSGNVLVTGRFGDTVDFDPGAGVANLSVAGNGDIFVAQYSNSGAYQWAISMGGASSDRGNGIVLDGSGNVLVTGTFRGDADFDPGPGDATLSIFGDYAPLPLPLQPQDVFIAKYNAMGAYQWAGQIGFYNPSGMEVENLAVAIDAQNNSYITGYIEGTADFDPGPGTAILTSPGVAQENIFVAKYDAAGAYQWAFSLTPQFSLWDGQGRAIAVDGSDNVLVAGQFEGTIDFDPGPGTAELTNISFPDGFIAKYSSSGDYLWAFSLDVSFDSRSRCMTVDGSGNVLVTGSFSGTVDFDPGAGTADLTSAGENDIFVAKYSSSGAYLWAFSMGGANSELGRGIAVDGSDNVLVTGYIEGTADFDPGAGTANLTSAGDRDIFVAKYSPAGAYQWAINMGGASSDQSFDIALDGSNNVLITGSFFGTADFDPGAGTANLTSAGFSDAFVAKYNESGAYQWAFNITGANPSIGFGIAADISNKVFVTGYFSGTADFDPGMGTANLISAGSDDIFVAQYDALGTYQAAFSVGNTQEDRGRAIALDGLGNALVAGFFRGSPDFDPQAGSAIRVSLNRADGFLAKYSFPCLSAGVLYVNHAASGANNGSSWTNAFNDLQDALTLASRCPDVTEIWVAQGAYYPDEGVGYMPGNRAHSFVMQNNLAIYGGFPGLPGQEGDFGVRNPAAFPTRLSGDIGTADNDSDNSYHVVYNFQNGLDDSAILDGFTISGGNANGGGFDTRGGGMYNSFVSPLIVNCIFTANQADLGGGVYNTSPSTPTFVNCLFFSNTATSGSGALNDIASARYVNCTFSAHPGFALSNVDATPVLANCIIWGNGAGISNSGSGSNVAAVTYSIVQGGYSGTGNLNQDPLFVDPAAGNFRLQEDSPAIDAGNNAEIPLGILNDLGGNPRILQSTVDMGAFEYRSNIPTMGQWAFLLFGLSVFMLMVVSLWNVRRVKV